MEVLPDDHQEAVFYTLHFDVLLFCLQFPHVRRMPLLDYTTRGGGVAGSEPVYTTTGAGYHMWPSVQVDGEECCVPQLLGLLQFQVIPRHPQHVVPKCVSWGYDDLGRMRTTVWSAGRDDAEMFSDSDSD